MPDRMIGETACPKARNAALSANRHQTEKNRGLRDHEAAADFDAGSCFSLFDPDGT
jgi:hypothetical protein